MYTYEQFTSNTPQHRAAAEQISEWSQSAQSMIPLTPDAMAAHPLGYLAFAEGELAGYAAVSVQYSDTLYEFGGLVVGKDYRGHGIGKSATQWVLQQIPTQLPQAEQIIAFANDKSGPLFEKYVGSRALTQLERCTLAKEVWKLCLSCPSRAADFNPDQPECCDTVVDLSDYVRAIKHATIRGADAILEDI
jgi:GNAT superfamily N-acetyltransferase